MNPNSTNTFLILIICVTTLLCACAGIHYNDKVTVVDTLSANDEISCRVLAKAEEWRNSGLAVKAGTKYRVQAEGRWIVGGTCGWTGPDGIGVYNAFAWDNNWKVLQGYSHGILLGKVGENGSPFAVGNFYEFTAQSDGILYFRINDAVGACGDNDGFVTARISIVSQGKQAVQTSTTPTVACDLRVVRVTDGSVQASATGQSTSDKLEDLGRALAGKLKEGVLIKGETLAVISFANRAGSPTGKTLSDELADKVTGALVNTGWFDVKERVNLRSIVAERDLELAGIVTNENVKEKLSGVKYIVMGGVTVSRSDNK